MPNGIFVKVCKILLKYSDRIELISTAIVIFAIINTVEMSNASKVKDMSLASWGRKEMDLAEV